VYNELLKAKNLILNCGFSLFQTQINYIHTAVPQCNIIYVYRCMMMMMMMMMLDYIYRCDIITPTPMPDRQTSIGNSKASIAAAAAAANEVLWLRRHGHDVRDIRRVTSARRRQSRHVAVDREKTDYKRQIGDG